MPSFTALRVATVVVVNSPLDRARFYFTRRPTPLVLAADPERASHRAFGEPAATPTLMTRHGLTLEQRDALLFGPDAVRVDPTGELGQPLPFREARQELNRRDGYVLTPDEEERRAAGPGFQMLFLIDRNGVIRWRWVEASKRPRDIGLLLPMPELLLEIETMVVWGDASR